MDDRFLHQHRRDPDPRFARPVDQVDRRPVVVVHLAAVAQHAVDERGRDAALLHARAGVTGAGEFREPGHRGLAIGRTDDGEGCARGWLKA